MLRSKSACRIARVPRRSSNHLLGRSRNHIDEALADLVCVSIQRTRGRTADDLPVQVVYAGMAWAGELLGLLVPSVRASQVSAMRIENENFVRQAHYPGHHLRIVSHPSLDNAPCDRELLGTAHWKVIDLSHPHPISGLGRVEKRTDKIRQDGSRDTGAHQSDPGPEHARQKTPSRTISHLAACNCGGVCTIAWGHGAQLSLVAK